METSMGGCTRGINIALVPSEGNWEAQCDYVMLMDTEGLCNPNFAEEPWYNHHNNWLAALSILGPDVCCLLSNNEDDTLVRTVLPFAMLSHHNAEDTLAKAGFDERRLFFVYNKVDPSQANDCLKDNRLSMMKTLEEKKKEIKEIKSSKKGRNPFSLVRNGQFSYLGPDLNDPKGYGKNVVELRKTIDATLGRNFKAVSLEVWWGMFSSLLGALKLQDFALSFDFLKAIEVIQDHFRMGFWINR